MSSLLSQLTKRQFSDETILLIWKKGMTVPGYNADLFRKDICTAWMSFSKYGDRTSKLGWEIDHINPNGIDNYVNLQPLQWENNVAKGDGPLTCKVTSNGNQNI